jgi:hypothetical protein
LEEILRGKFRESLSAPKPMVPRQVAWIEIGPGDRCHTFLKGPPRASTDSESVIPDIRSRPTEFRRH